MNENLIMVLLFLLCCLISVIAIRISDKNAEKRKKEGLADPETAEKNDKVINGYIA